MITSSTFNTKPLFAVKTNNPDAYPGLSGVFAAAVVNREFRDLLLRDPISALEKGYLGEHFSLSKEEQRILTSIRADTLSDLAQKILIVQSTGG